MRNFLFFLSMLILVSCNQQKPEASSQNSQQLSSSAISSETQSLSEPILQSEPETEHILQSEPEVEPIPEIISKISSETVTLGDIVLLTLENVPKDTDLLVQTNIDWKIQFYPIDQTYSAVVPISYFTIPGNYKIDIKVGESDFSHNIEVKMRDFEVQNLTVDQATTDSTINSNKANVEWKQKIDPIRPIVDPQIYWNESFLIPVEGRITTNFGIIRYTNGSKNASRHGAIDIAAPTGTPVKAANDGRIVFSELTQLSGNVVVIEHGLGVKTWYYHMDELKANVGDMVKKGDTIGTVGATGFVTGPHLHYAVSVNNVYIDPYIVSDENSPLK